MCDDESKKKASAYRAIGAERSNSLLPFLLVIVKYAVCQHSRAFTSTYYAHYDVCCVHCESRVYIADVM